MGTIGQIQISALWGSSSIATSGDLKAALELSLGSRQKSKIWRAFGAQSDKNLRLLQTRPEEEATVYCRTY